MNLRRAFGFVLGLLAAAPLFLRADVGVTFNGVGQLAGSSAPASEIRDAANTPSGLVAVGSGRLRSGSIGGDTAAVWTPGGGLVALPNLVTNNTATNFVTASAITPNGSLILGRSRSVASGGMRVATTWAINGTNPVSLGALANTGQSAAIASSTDGSVVYGFDVHTDANGTTDAFRWTGAGGMVALGFLNAGDMYNFPAPRGASADGNVMVGTSGALSINFPNFPSGFGPGNRAYRYVSGSGMTALPLPAGGTWSAALAVSPDGNLVLGVGDSTAFPQGPDFPQGELLLWNISAGTTTALGAPVPNGGPGNLGGMSSDGAVAVINFGDDNGNQSFVRNSHGWFNLHAVIAKAGVDLSDWQVDSVLGMSSDATIVFGSGQHNGTTEGWVATFPAGYLAGVTSAAKLGFASVTKIHRSAQTDANVVADSTEFQPWHFRAGLDGDGFTVSDPPAPRRVTLAAGSATGFKDLLFPNDQWFYETVNDVPNHGYASQAALDGDYANGTYSFQVAAATASLPLTGDLYPAALKVTASAGTWSGGKLHVDASQALTLSTTYGATNYAAGQSFLGIEVKDSDFDANNAKDATPFTNQNVSLTIPASSLQPGRTYWVELDAIRVVTFDQASLAPAIAISGYEALTDLYIQTDPSAFTVTSPNTITAAQGVPFNFSVFTQGGTNPLTYAVTGGSLPSGLSLNASNGQISGTPTQLGTSTPTITVTDSSNPVKTASATFTANVVSMFIGGNTNLTAIQGQNFNYQVRVFGGTAPFSYAVTNGSLPAGLSLNSSGIISGTATTTGPANITITATDSAGSVHTAQANYSINVNAFGIPSPLFVNGTVGTAFSFQVPVGGGVGPYTFTASNGMPAGLTMSNSGLITGTPTIVNGNFNTQITVTDSTSGTHLVSSPASLTFNNQPAALAISSPLTARAVKNSNFNYQVQVTGGSSPYTYAATGLPAGLSISGNGQISGNPTSAGSTNVDLSVTDNNGTNVHATLVIGVLNFGITSPLTFTGARNLPFGYSITTQGGVGSVTYGATNLPAGLTLNTSTGFISGTPTALGNTAVTLSAVDSSGTPQTDSVTLNLSVVTMFIGGQTTLKEIQGQNFNYQVVVVGGTAPYNYSVTNGSLPTGLSLNASTGVISGTATTSGSSNATITVTDSAATQNSAQIQFFSNVSAFGIPSPLFVNGTVGTAFNFQVPAFGGVTPYTFTSNGMPGGLSMSSTGAITGTPTIVNSSFQTTVTVTDSTPGTHLSASGSLFFNNQAAGLSITSPLTARGVKNSNFNYQVQVTGGSSPYTYAATGLPAGLSISGNGQISGNPTSAGSTNVDLSVTDNNGTNVHATLVIGVLNFGITSPLTFTGARNLPFGYSITTQGGVGSVTYGATNLPAGLTLNTSTGFISGTPTTNGNSAVTLSATDSSGTPQTDSVTLNLSIVTMFIGGQTNLKEIQGQNFNYQVVVLGGTAPYNYSVTGGSLPAGLSLNPSTGVISGTASTTGSSNATITVTDSAGTPNTAQTQFFSNVNAFGIPSPLFVTGTVGTAFSFTVPAAGGVTPYTFTSNGLPAGLSMDSSTGAITGTPTIVNGSFNSQITVTDSTPGTHLTASATLFFNNQAAAITITSPLTAPGVKNSNFNYQVQATGGTTPYTFAATNLPAGLSINAGNGTISGNPTNAGSTNVGLTVTDNSGGSVSATLVINVANFGVTSPLNFTGAKNVPFGYSINTQGGVGTITYGATNLPAGLTLNTSTGFISGTPTTLGNSAVTLSVTDSSATPQTGTATLNLSIVTMFVNSQTTLKFIQGQAFNSPIKVAGGTAPYTFAVTSGSLPNGISLNSSTGVISGTANTLGSSSVTITVTDSTAGTPNTAPTTFFTNVNAFGIPSPLFVNGTIGAAFSFQVPAAGGQTPYAFTSNPLPAGLSMNSSGLITGTPTIVNSSFNTTINVTDSTSGTPLSASASLTFNNQPAAPVITSPLTANGVRNSNFNYQVQVSGGSSPFTYAATNLPAGLSINSGNGSISGNPTNAGSTNVGLTVTDNNGGSVQATLVINIAAYGITSSLTQTAARNVPFSYTINTQGAVGTQTYSATGLPAGLTINATSGRITGTPTTLGNSAINLSVTDSSATPQTATATLNLSVVTMFIPGQTSLKAIQGQTYNYQVQVAGGTGPYNYTVTSGSLPNGLALGALNGTITGTATTLGQFNFTITVTDSAGTPNTAQASFSANVNAFGIPSPLFVNGTVGTAFSYQVPAAAGGQPGYTYTAGSLPQGLSMDSNGLITGTPTIVNNSFNATITVTDSTTPTHLSATTSLFFNNQPAPITVTSPLTVGAVKNASFNYSTQVTGGLSPYTFAATGLPAGLTLNTGNGGISGTPTAAGSSNVDLSITDTLGTNVHVTLVINVANFGITSSLTFNAARNVPFNYNINTLGGVGTITYGATNLPPGLTLNGSTISGTPTTLGNTAISLSAVDSSAPTPQTATATLNLSVVPMLITGVFNNGAINLTAIQNQSYSYQVRVAGGTGTITYAITGGSLPSGLTLNTSTGVISGTASSLASAVSVTITATDSASNTAQATFRTSVNAFGIASPIFLNGTVGSSFSFQLPAPAGGSSPYAYTSTGMPAGLALDGSTGLISGIPTVVNSSFNSTVTVTDATTPTHLSASVTLTFNNQPAPFQITAQPASSTTVTSGQNVTLTVAATGPGTLTYRWRRGGFDIASATNATYTISGAVRADAGTYDVVVTSTAGSIVSEPALVRVAPTAYPGLIAPDFTWDPNPLTISTRTFAAVKLSNGQFIVGGESVSWDGQVRTALARLNADLTLDTSWTPPLVNGVVYALALAPDGTVYFGGDFTAVDGHPRAGLARLITVGGNLVHDLAWRSKDPMPANATTQVSALAVQDNGQLLVARLSFFTNAINHTDVLRRLNLDGTHDTSLSVDIVANNGSRVTSLIAEPGTNPAIALAGTFTQVGPVAGHNALARISNTGTVDANFGGSAGTNGPVNFLSRLADGRYIVVGNFGGVGGVTRNHIALLTAANGSVDTGFVPPSGTTDGFIQGATMLSDGRIVAVGNFSVYAGLNAAGIVRFNANGTGAIETAFTVGAGAQVNPFTVATNAGRNLHAFTLANNQVGLIGTFNQMLGARRVTTAVIDGAVANADAGDTSKTLLATPSSLVNRPAFTGSAFLERNGELTVFGSIHSAAGTSNLGHIVRFTTSGGIDSGFPNGAGLGLTGLSTFGAYRATRQGDGKFVVIGDFVSYNGSTANHLVRINANGSIDSSFDAGAGPNIYIVTPHSLAGGKTLLFGSFGSNFTYNGAAVAGNIMRLKADGSRDDTFNVGSGFGSSVNAVIEIPDPESTGGYPILVGGGFTTYNGAAAPGIAALDGTGTPLADFDPGTGVTGGNINGFTLYAPGKIVMFGNFTGYNGTPANHVAIFDLDTGGLDPNFTAPASLDGPVGQVLVQEDGKLIVVGEFSTGAAVRLLANGTVDPTFALLGITSIPGGGGSMRLTMADNGSLYVNNSLLSLNNGVIRGLTHFAGAAVAPTVTTAPVGGAINLGVTNLLWVQAGGTGPYTYQWRKDGNDLTGETNSVLAIPNATNAAAGTYIVAITGPGGTVLSSPVQLTAVTAPTITAQPQSQAVSAGQALTLHVTVTGTGPFTYDWRKGGTTLGAPNSATFTVNSAQAGDAGSYTVFVTGPGGTILSGAANVSVLSAGFSATHQLLGTGYVAGSTVTVTNTLAYPEDLSSLTWTILVPPGWKFVSGTYSSNPAVEPDPTDPSGSLSWLWSTIPANGLTFTYTLSVPAAATGAKEFAALVEMTRTSDTGHPVQFLAKPDPLPVSPLTFHDADTNGNEKIDVTELSRVITLYNARFTTVDGKVRTGAYSVATGTADGFAPDPTRDPAATVTLTRYHSADTNHNGKIDVTELSRVITLYNTRYTTVDGKIRTGYYRRVVVPPDTATVDGFTPDPTRAP